MPRGIDTFVGRPVERIDEDENGNWFVELAGGVRVTNLDKNFKKPIIDESKLKTDGIRFVSVVLSDTQTQMVLATLSPVNGQIQDEYRAVFNAVHYSIYDPSQGEPYAPQAGNIQVNIPPMPEREYDGPLVQDERTPDSEEEKPKKSTRQSKKSKKADK